MRFLSSAARILAAALVASCARHDKTGDVSLNVSVNNATKNEYWVELDWTAVPVGILSPGASATTVGIDPPSSNFVTLDLTSPTNHQNHIFIKQDVSKLKQLSPGHHDVTISIISETETKLSIDGREK